MIKIVDVFAGPGGLNEGFSKLEAVDGSPVFQVAGSFEVDPIAVETLKFRAAAREVGLLSHGAYRDFLNSHWSIETLMRDRDFAEAHARAGGHVYELRLGAETRSTSDELIRKNLNGDDRWVLVGGPPCQAYSLVGRSRMGHLETFVDDERHFLFKEYLHIIREHRPTVFVMENVKGLLSATHRGTRMFDRIMEDLSCGGEYEIRSFVVPGQSLEPRDYVIRSEDFGVPQRRHRVILLGLRVGQGMREPQVLKAAEVQSSLRHAVGQDLPALRSKVSPLRDDSPGAWVDARRTGAQFAGIEGRDAEIPAQYSGPERYTGVAPAGPLGAWLRDPRQEYVLQHEPRSHMRADLERYSYLANMAAAGEHPTLRELPADLLPNHRNVDRQNTPFVDRFKVQAWNRPSSTIVSHISKDGHHFIHPDPAQVRSLTVREAARLQTFPDDYFFMGNRTQQYHQVGNAVPPYLANQVAQVVANLMRN